MRLDCCADVPVEKQHAAVVADVMMHDGPEGRGTPNVLSDN